MDQNSFLIQKWFNCKGIERSLEEENTVDEKDEQGSDKDLVGDDKTVEKIDNIEADIVGEYCLPEDSFLDSFDKRILQGLHKN